MTRRFLLAGAFVALALAAAFGSWQTTPSSAQMGGMNQGGQMGPGDPMATQLDQVSGDDFDRAFLVQMSMHHAMAIAMARPPAANAAHQETKDLANAIIAAQAAEIAQMADWLKAWYAMDQPMMMVVTANSNQGPMSMDGHQMMGDMPMTGMMGDLWKLPGPRLEAVFLSQMIPHHQGAVEMAHLAYERAGHQEIKDLSHSIEASQTNEVQKMNDWLKAWYGL
jgi:uncharacterized protein (DUF305 family)